MFSTGSRQGFIVFLLAVIAYAPYFRALHFGEESGAYLYHYFSSFDGIAIGCLTAMYAQHFKGAIYNQKMIVAATALLMTALYFYAPIKEVSTWGISVFALLTALLILCFTQDLKVNLSHTRHGVWSGLDSVAMKCICFI